MNGLVSESTTELWQYKIPLKKGHFREGIILKTPTGFGDIAPLPGFSRETLAQACAEALRCLHDGPLTIPQLPSVRFAFDCARAPIPALQVPINALNVVRPGFTALKIKVGHLTIEEAIAQIRQAPKTLELRLDFNQQWPLEKLLAFSNHFSAEEFAYLEEPTQSFSDLMLFSQKTGFPIAVDESIPDVPYLEIPTLKALIVKPTILGCIPPTKPNVELIFSSAFESGVGVLHLARLAAENNPYRPHGLDPYSHLQEDILSIKPTLEQGFLKWNSAIHLQHGSLCKIATFRN